MARVTPIATTTHDLDRDPAARAWASLGGRAPARVTLLRRASRSKPAIHRLAFDPPGSPAVYGKRFHAAGLAHERRIYETVLPRLPVPTARYLGACEDADGSAWMFVEDVGDACMSPVDPGHRALAARWLALLHRSAAERVADLPLPDAGPARYRAHLVAGRAEIRRRAGNRALTPADREVLAAVIGRTEALEALWPRIERACAAWPVTLVHADFQPKNVRLRQTADGPVVCPIDWEMAGRGVPAADLALASSPSLAMHVDPAAYEAGMRERWPALDAAAVHRLSVVGHLFQALAGIDWASADLVFESAPSLIRPVSSMRRYLARIAEALAAAEDWLV